MATTAPALPELDALRARSVAAGNDRDPAAMADLGARIARRRSR
jgi:hypothetical protein